MTMWDYCEKGVGVQDADALKKINWNGGLVFGGGLVEKTGRTS